MRSPFVAVNEARLRAERRAALARAAGLGATLLLILPGAIALGHLALTAALALPAHLEQAETLKGM